MKTEDSPKETNRLWLATFFVTLLTLAGISSWFLWLFCRLMQSSIALASDRPMAPLTTFFIDYRLGVLLFPLPWLIVSVCSFLRGRIVTHHLVLFSSSLILTLGTLSVAMAVGFSLPWLPTKLMTNGIKPPSATPGPR